MNTTPQNLACLPVWAMILPTLTVSQSLPQSTYEPYTCTTGATATRALVRLITRYACFRAALVAFGALLTFVALPARAAVTEAWVQRYSNIVSNSNDAAYKVVHDVAGDIIVTGSTEDGIHGQDMLTIKYSGADGTMLWVKRYNGPANKDDSPTALAVDASGNVVVTGYSSNGTNKDYYTAKYAAADGTLLWESPYNGSENGDHFPNAVAVDSSGNVVVTGCSSNGTNNDFYTAKYAAVDGALLWEKRYNGPGNGDDQAQAVAVDASGNVVVTGYSSNGTNSDYYTANYAAKDGVLLWEKRFNGSANHNDAASAVAVDGSNGVIVTGSSYNGTDFDYYTAKYAMADGALLWETRYDGPANGADIPTALAVDSSGNVVVTGSSVGSASDADFYTAKYAAANGALLWEKRHNGSGNSGDYASAVSVDGSGNAIVTGNSYNGNYGYYTAKYAAADGALLWERRFNGSANGTEYSFAIAVDHSCDVVATGLSYIGTSQDYYTAKYAAADGALLWEKRYNGPSKGHNPANAVAVDGSGNVVVTGSSDRSANNPDYYTAKFSAADGSLVWEKRYNGPANGNDQALAMMLDGNGNVVVTGYSSNGTNDDYYTAKYGAADGVPLWEKRYNGPANGADYSLSIAVDQSGDVVVTGMSVGDSYTVKYAAVDGALLWEKRTSGDGLLVEVDPKSGDVLAGMANSPYGGYSAANSGVAVAVDGSSNVILMRGNHLAKYTGTRGSLLWEQRFNDLPYDPFNGVFPQALAVDRSGNAVVTGVARAMLVHEIYSAQPYTAKYAATDGSLLWNINAGVGDVVAVDGNGNVIVPGPGFSTAKYGAADGALLWEKRYNGPANGNDHATAMAVDRSGNVVVSGTSSNGTNYDYYTAKYAGADGTLLWEQRYNGPANGTDIVGNSRSLALGPNGMVAVTGSSDRDYATVVYRENLNAVSIERFPAGIRLRFAGVPGRSYSIEHAPTVTGPWSSLAVPSAPLSGVIEYVDTNAPPSSAFYRTSTP